jgi:hypothetical protein
MNTQATMQGQPETVQHQPVQNNPASKQGAQRQVGDIAASVKDSLYSPGETSKSKLKIIGDPDLILNETHSANLIFNRDWFLPDGTLNHFYSDLWFVLFVNKSNDWDPSTGIVNFQDNPAGVPNFSTGWAVAYIYKSVISTFTNGGFYQEIEGIAINSVNPLVPIYAGDQTITYPGVTPADSSVQSQSQERAETTDTMASTTPDIRTPSTSLPGQAAVTPAAAVPPILAGSTAMPAAPAAVTTGIFPNYNSQASAQRLQSAQLTGDYIGQMMPGTQQGDLES